MVSDPLDRHVLSYFFRSDKDFKSVLSNISVSSRFFQTFTDNVILQFLAFRSVQDPHTCPALIYFADELNF